jgi:hypothetical protein
MKLMGEPAEAGDKKPTNSNKSAVPVTAVPVVTRDNRCMVRSLSLVRQFSLVRLYHKTVIGSLLFFRHAKALRFTFQGFDTLRNESLGELIPLGSGNISIKPRNELTVAVDEEYG